DDTGETGLFGTLDNANDASVDLTIDFGFQSPVGIGNLVFTDQNGNGHADAGEGVEGVRVELYGGLQDPTNSLPLFTQFTDAQGHFFFNFLPTGTYKVHIPPQEFGTGQPLFGALPLPLESTPGDDDVGQNAQPETNPEINGVTTLTVALNADTEPVDSGIETGSANTLDAVDDDNHDLTIDLGFVAPAANQTGVGNLVYGDGDGDGVYDPGEGIANVMVQVFHSGDDPLVDPPIAFGVNSQGNPITHVLTDSSGCYLIYGLGEGDYFVFLPPVNFQAGGPLSGWFSLPGSGGDTGSDDGLDENGVDAAVPSSSGIASDVIHLALGTEPTDFDSEFGKAPAMDAFADSNVDLTVDFGFHQTVAVGNLVFLDADGDGVADAGEGVANVTVELYDGYSIPGWDSPMATTSTNSDGVYEFSGLTPGSYQVHLPMANFAPNAVLEGKVNLTGNGVGDDDVNEDGVDQAQPEWFGVTSSIFYLAAGSAPTGAAEGGLFGTSDDANDASVDLTIDFGFSSPVGVGNLVFFDSNNNGIFEAGTETGVPNVLVQLHDANAPGVPVTETYTDADGLYSFSISSGSYVIHIPASQFDLYAPLYQYVSSTGGGVVPPGTLGDDDVGEDGVDGGNPLVDGVTSASFTLAAGSMPTAADTET
ncbi:MAG: hypothetical protein KDM64_13910, partial [Verrucomicrobiae bacterium]|nr:hypothetical protein [Verrucomicrobiae bacterium]